MSKKTEDIKCRIAALDKHTLEEMARVSDVAVSVIVRQAVRDYIKKSYVRADNSRSAEQASIARAA